MDTSLPLNRIRTIQVNLVTLIVTFAKLVVRLPRLTRPADDPAALRYVASKYYNEID